MKPKIMAGMLPIVAVTGGISLPVRDGDTAGLALSDRPETRNWRVCAWTRHRSINFDRCGGGVMIEKPWHVALLTGTP